MATTTIPASLEGSTHEQRLNYLDRALFKGSLLLRGTSLEWAIKALNDLLAEDTPARHCYADAPASSSLGRHHCYAGGLMYHSIEVFYLTAWMYSSIITPATNRREDFAAAWVASILHDMNKCCDPLGRPCYIDNTLKGGNVSDRKPWKHNDQFMQMDLSTSGGPPVLSGFLPPGVADHQGASRMLQLANRILNTESKRIGDGKFSYAISCLFSPELERLPATIVQAIYFHDGGYGQGRYELVGNEDQLTILLHAADMMSSRFEGNWEIDPIDSLISRLPYVEVGVETPLA